MNVPHLHIDSPIKFDRDWMTDEWRVIVCLFDRHFESPVLCGTGTLSIESAHRRCWRYMGGM